MFDMLPPPKFKQLEEHMANKNYILGDQVKKFFLLCSVFKGSSLTKYNFYFWVYFTDFLH